MSAAPGLLEGRVAVVTGGASGIGAGIVSLFATAGARGAVLDASRAECPAGWRAFETDVRDDGSVAAAFARAHDAFGEVDVLVAAAGIVPSWSRLGSLDLEVWDEVMRVNARGVASTFQHALPSLKDGAAIVVVASLNGWRGDANQAAYTASKHAVVGLVRSAALDLGGRGMRVNAVAPGPIATQALLARMAHREEELGVSVEEALAGAARETALGRIATVQEVAGAVLFLASDLAGGVTGQLLHVDGGLG